MSDSDDDDDRVF